MAKIGRIRDNSSDMIKKLCSNLIIGSERRTKLSITSHIQNLKQKHEKLSSEVEQAYKSPASDELYISQLKKEKLRLKEEISRLSR
tara:strand:+ start:371 stop:628 length:258 start_codon:yes stop_codon:yes gene_type:complete